MQSMLRAMLLFFTSAVSVFGADPLGYIDKEGAHPLIDYFPIIVYGETGGTASIYQFVSTVAENFTDGALGGIWTLAVGTTIVVGFYKAYIMDKLEHGFKEIIFVTFFTVVLALPANSVYIYDGRTSSATETRIVDNIPYFTSATASFVSTTTAAVMSFANDASAPVGQITDFNFGAQGYAAPEMFALKAIQQIHLDDNTTTALGNVVKECLIPNSIDSSYFTHINDFKTSDGRYSSFEGLRELASKDEMKNTTMSNGHSCSEYIGAQFSATAEKKLEDQVNAVLANLTFVEQEKLALLAAHYFGMSDKPDVDTKTFDQTIGNFIGYAKNYAFNGGMAGALHNARAESLGGGDSIAVTAGAVAAASVGNIQTGGVGNLVALAEIVPNLLNMLINLTYAASILMAMIVLWSGYEKGLIIMKDYIIGLAMMQSVTITFVLVNNYMLYYAQDNAIGKLSGQYANPAAMPNIGPHLDYLARMAGTAGAWGLGVALAIPSIIFFGKVASLLGMISSASGAVQNKSPQDVSDSMGQELGRQRAMSDARMRNELRAHGIEVPPGGDVGAIHANLMNNMDKAAGDLAASSMYKDYDKRYGATQAQSLMTSAGLNATGAEASKLSFDTMKTAGAASAAASFTNQIAQGTAMTTGSTPAFTNEGGVSSDFKAGQVASAQKQVGATVGTGKEAGKHSTSEIMGSAEAEASEALATSIAKYDKAKKEGFVGRDNTMGDLGRFAIAEEAGTSMDQRINKAAAMHMNKALNPDIYGVNALASELSQTQSAYASMLKKGGVAGSVDMDVASAEIAAIESKSSLKSKLKTLGAKGNNLSDQVDTVESKLADISGTQTRKQTNDSIGSTKGLHHEMDKKGGDKNVQNVAQSAVESQIESGLGSIAGAGGIHSLASQAGTKARSDANALRATIATAGGANGFVAMNQTLAVGNTMGQLAEIGEATSQFGSYGNYKATSARGAVDMAKAIFDAEVSSGFKLSSGKLTTEGKDSIVNEKGKELGSKLAQKDAYSEDAANAENAKLMEKTKATNEDMVRNGLMKKNSEGEYEATSGVERAIAAGRMAGADQFGMKGGAFLMSNGDVMKVGIQTVSNSKNGVVASNVTSVVMGTALNPNSLNNGLDISDVAAGEKAEAATNVGKIASQTTARTHHAVASGAESAGMDKQTASSIGELAGDGVIAGIATATLNGITKKFAPVESMDENGKTVKKGWASATWDGAKALWGEKKSTSSSDSSLNAADNKTSDGDNHQSSHSVSDHESDHGKTPSSDMSNSTTSQNHTQSKSPRLEAYHAEQKAKIDAAFGRSPGHGNIAEAHSPSMMENIKSMFSNIHMPSMASMMQAGKVISSALMDGTALSPTSLGAGSDIVAPLGGGVINPRSLAAQQHDLYQAMGQHQAYIEATKYSGTYGNIQTAIASNPVSSMMQSSPLQAASAHEFVAAATNRSQENNIQMQNHAQVQSENIREISRSMGQMVAKLRDMGTFFEDVMGKKEDYMAK